MKKLGLLVAAIALLTGFSVAKAADNAWFTLEGSSGAGAGSVVVVQQGGPGQALIVEKQGDVSLNIAYRFTNSYATGMSGWAIALSAIGPGANTFSDGANAGLTGYDSSNGGTTGGPAFFAGQTSSAGTGGQGRAYNFTLNSLGQGALAGITNVTGDFGPSEQAYGGEIQGAAWYGFVGPNPISYGRVGYVGSVDTTPGWGSLPVIIVRNVPEPATIVLLGLGAVALIRRKR